MSFRRTPSSLALLVSLLSLTAAARADSVSVTGMGRSGSDLDQLSVSAGAFTASSAAPGGPSLVGGGASPFGVPLSLEWGVSAFAGPGFTIVNFGSQFTDILGGGINFTSTFTVPLSALMTGVFTAPVTVIGELQAFQDLLLGNGSEFEPNEVQAASKITRCNSSPPRAHARQLRVRGSAPRRQRPDKDTAR